MRALKIAGLIALVLWMVWITWRIEQVRNLALEACQGAYMAKGHEALPACPGAEFVISGHAGIQIRTLQSGGRFFVVDHVGPIDSPAKAVRAAIVAEARGRQ